MKKKRNAHIGSGSIKFTNDLKLHLTCLNPIYHTWRFFHWCVFLSTLYYNSRVFRVSKMKEMKSVI